LRPPPRAASRSTAARHSAEVSEIRERRGAPVHPALHSPPAVRAAGCKPKPSNRLLGRIPSPSSCRFLAWLREAHLEMRPPFAFPHRNQPPVGVHILLGDGKPQSAALEEGLARRAALVEGIEDSLRVRGRHPWSLVEDVENNVSVLAPQPHLHFATQRR